MADRTSAHLFGSVFKLLAEGAPPDKIAKTLWVFTADYDFSNYQMYADEALKKLGLARHVPDPDNPEQTCIQYKHYDGVDWDDE